MEAIMKRRRWKDIVTFLLGMWLFVSPWSLGYISPDSVPAGVPAWNFLFSGAIVGLLGIAALVTQHLWEEWAKILLAAWLVMSPWILRFTFQPIATWNALICGVAIFVLTSWILTDQKNARGI
jgi:hypothetical protein